MSNILSPHWLQHFYQFESMDDLQHKLVFTESAAEKHMLEIEIKRREVEANDKRSRNWLCDTGS